MAREIAINMVIDTKDAQADLVLVEESLNDIEQSLKKIGAGGAGGLDKELEKLNRLTTESTMTWGEMGKAIEQYQNIALAAGKESPVGQEAIRRASELKQEMDLVTQSVDGLSKKGQNLQAALQLGGTVVAGYGVAQSAMALMGTESEKLQETFVKLQLAQTALVSIEQIRMSLQKESFLMQKLTTMWTTAQTFATGLLAKAKLGDAAATGVATTATRAFTAALIATGIGAIVVALGLLIANFDKVSEAVIAAAKWVQGLAKKFREMEGWVQIVIGYFTFGLVPAISYLIKALEDFGVVETEEMRRSAERRKKQVAAIQKETAKKIELIDKEIDSIKKLTQEVTDSIDWEIKKRQAAGEEFAELEKEKIMMLIRSTKQELNLIAQKIAAKEEELNKTKEVNSLMNAMQKATFETDKQLQENFLDEQLKELELWTIKQEKVQKESSKKKAEDKKKANEKELADEKKHQEDLLAARLKAIADEEAVTDAYRKRQLTNEQKEIDDLQEKLYTELELAGENNELKLLLEEEYQSNVAAIRDKYRLQEEEEEKKAEEKRKADNDKELKEKQELEYAKLGLITNTLSLSAKIADLFAGRSEKAARVAFNVKKAADISSATLDGYKAVVSTLADTPGGPVVRGIAATLVGGFAAAQIAAIAKTPFGGGGGGSVSGAVGSITSGAVGRSDIGNQTDTTTNIEQLLNGNQGQGNQPVLVTDSLTKVQNKQAKIESLATL